MKAQPNLNAVRKKNQTIQKLEESVEVEQKISEPEMMDLVEKVEN